MKKTLTNIGAWMVLAVLLAGPAWGQNIQKHALTTNTLSAITSPLGLSLLDAEDAEAALGILGITTGAPVDWENAPLVNPSVADLSPTNKFRWTDELDFGWIPVTAYGIERNTGSRIDPGLIQNAIAAAQATGAGLYWPSGEYLMDSVTVSNATRVAMKGDGVTTILKMSPEDFTGAITNTTISAIDLKMIGGTNAVTEANFGTDTGFAQFLGGSGFTNVALGQSYRVAGFADANWNGWHIHATASRDTGVSMLRDEVALVPNMVDGAISISQITWTNDHTAIVYTTAAHGKSPSDSVTLANVSADLNGTYTIASTPTANSFVIPKAFPSIAITYTQPYSMFSFSQTRQIGFYDMKLDGNWPVGRRGRQSGGMILIAEHGTTYPTAHAGLERLDLFDLDFNTSIGAPFVRRTIDSFSLIRMNPAQVNLCRVRARNWGDASAFTFKGPGSLYVDDLYGFCGGPEAEGGWTPNAMTGEGVGNGLLGWMGMAYSLEDRLIGPSVRINNVRAEYCYGVFGGGFNCRDILMNNVTIRGLSKLYNATNKVTTGWNSTDRGLYNGTGFCKIDDGPLVDAWRSGSWMMNNVNMVESGDNVGLAFQYESTNWDRIGHLFVSNCFFDRSPSPMTAVFQHGNFDCVVSITDSVFDYRNWLVGGSSRTMSLFGVHSAYATNTALPTQYITRWQNCSFLADLSNTNVAQINLSASGNENVRMDDCYFSDVYVSLTGPSNHVVLSDCEWQNTQHSRAAINYAASVGNRLILNDCRRLGPYQAQINTGSLFSQLVLNNCTLDIPKGVPTETLSFNGGSMPTYSRYTVLEDSTTPRLWPTTYLVGGQYTVSFIPTNDIVTITVTNLPSDGNTVTVNGIAYTWRTTPSTASTEVKIGADVADSALNLATLWTATNSLPANPFVARSGAVLTIYGGDDQVLTTTQGGSALQITHAYLPRVTRSDTYATADTGKSITDIQAEILFSTSMRTNLNFPLLLGRRDTLVHNAAKIQIPGGANLSGPKLLHLRNVAGVWWVSGDGAGSLSDGDKGSITVSGTGATWTLDDSEVTSAKIANGAIVDDDVNSSAAIAWTKVSKSGAAPTDVGAAAATHASAHRQAGADPLWPNATDYYVETRFVLPSGNATPLDTSGAHANTAIAAGTTSATGSPSGRPIGVNLAASASPNSGRHLMTVATVLLIGGSEYAEFSIIPKRVTDQIAYIGFHDSVDTNSPVDGCYFKLINSTLTGETASNSTRTTTGTSYTLTVDVRYRLKVAVNAAANRVDFYLTTVADGVQVWTDYVTTNLPTGASRTCGHGMTCTSNGGVGGLMECYYMSYGYAKAVLH